MRQSAAWIAGLALVVHGLALSSGQSRHGNFGFLPHRRPFPSHLEPSQLGGIRPSRSSVALARCINPRLYFRNGLARLRFRGRVVKYVCRPGYTLFGDSVSTCNAGRWDRPVPVCAAPGCRLPTYRVIPHGIVENVRRLGLMLRFRCRLGYTLRGEAATFCDGRAWNGSTPSCIPTLADPDTSCDFEALDQCGWTTDLGSGPQFYRRHDTEEDDDVADTAGNGTASAAAPPSTSGHHMAFEIHGHHLAESYVGIPAKLVSPPYRPLRFRACFRFWYRLSCRHCSLMLQVLHSTDSISIWDSGGPRKGGWASVEVPKTLEDFQLVFSARIRQNDAGDVAIDDVSLGPECQDVPTAEPPPATTIQLPDDVTTEIDAGYTWETTTTDPGISASKEEASDSSSTKSNTYPVSTEKIIAATTSGQWSSEKPEATTHWSGPTTRAWPPQTTERPVSPSSAVPMTSSYAAPSPPSPPRATTSYITTAIPVTGPTTFFVTRYNVTTSRPLHSTPMPRVASTYTTTSSSSSRLSTESHTAPLLAVTRHPFSDAIRLLQTTPGRVFHPASTRHPLIATRTKPTSETASSTRPSVTIGLAVTTSTWHRVTTLAGTHPNVEGNTVGPEVPPPKVTPVRTSSAPSITTQIPTRRSSTPTLAASVKRTTHLPQTAASITSLAPIVTTATMATAHRGTASTLKASEVPVTKGPEPTSSPATEGTTTAPVAKPTKHHKKATETDTKPPKWTRKPVEKPGPASTARPVTSSGNPPHSRRPALHQTTSSLPTPRYPHSTQPPFRAPKFVPTEESNLLNADVKTPRTPSASGTRSRNDEDNEVMQGDDPGVAGLQEKHSAPAPAPGSSWSLPALLIAAGVILVATVTATALYRWRRGYRGSADDSEMKPLSKYADGDVSEMSS